MEATAPHSPRPGDGSTHHTLRRILIGAGLALLVVILIAVSVYAVAFVMLAPMMQ